MRVTSFVFLLFTACASVPAESHRDLPAALDPANPAGPESAPPPALAQAEPPAPVPHRQAEKPARPSYSCPMHPEVVSDHPGRCPKCGMNLEKKAAPDAGARK
jgi:hypothetical protein